jgi:hypothetical protein
LQIYKGAPSNPAEHVKYGEADFDLARYPKLTQAVEKLPLKGISDDSQYIEVSVKIKLQTTQPTQSPYSRQITTLDNNVSSPFP